MRNLSLSPLAQPGSDLQGQKANRRNRLTAHAAPCEVLQPTEFCMLRFGSRRSGPRGCGNDCIDCSKHEAGLRAMWKSVFFIRILIPALSNVNWGSMHLTEGRECSKSGSALVSLSARQDWRIVTTRYKITQAWLAGLLCSCCSPQEKLLARAALPGKLDPCEAWQETAAQSQQAKHASLSSASACLLMSGQKRTTRENWCLPAWLPVFCICVARGLLLVNLLLYSYLTSSVLPSCFFKTLI